MGIGTAAPSNRLVVGDDSNGSTGTPGNSLAIGNASGNSILSLGQSNTTLDKLTNFRAVSYDWKSNNAHEVGVIAQEIYEMFPEVVDRGDDENREIKSLDEKGVWGVRYHMLAPLALQGVKEVHNYCKQSAEDIKIMQARLEQHGRDIASIKVENERLKSKIKSKTARSKLLKSKILKCSSVLSVSKN